MKLMIRIITLLAIFAAVAAAVLMIFAERAHADEAGAGMPPWMAEPRYRAEAEYTARTGDDFSYTASTGKLGVTTVLAGRMADVEGAYTSFRVDDDDVANGYFPEALYEEVLTVTIAGQKDLVIIGLGAVSDESVPETRNAFGFALGAWSVWTSGAHDLKVGVGGATVPVFEIGDRRLSVIPVAQYTYTGRSLQVNLGVRNGFVYQRGIATVALESDLTGKSAFTVSAMLPWHGVISAAYTMEQHAFFIDEREERNEALSYEHVAVTLGYEQPLTETVSVSLSAGQVIESEYAIVDMNDSRQTRTLDDGEIYRAGLNVRF